jgi:hypothetical protein
MGLIRRLNHPATGEDIGWNYYDEFKPHEAPVPLGMTDKELLESCDGKFVNKMEILLADRLKSPDSGLQLKKQLEGHLQECSTKALSDFPNPADPERQRLMRAIDQAKTLVASRSV